jgi:hypothetical protein
MAVYFLLSFQAIQEAEIKRIMVSGHARKKSLGSPSQLNKNWVLWHVPVSE